MMILLIFSWRGARVVEWDGLENRWTRERSEGSNPSLSVMSDLEEQEGQIKDLLKDVRPTLAAADVLSQYLNVTTQTVDMFVSQFTNVPDFSYPP